MVKLYSIVFFFIVISLSGFSQATISTNHTVDIQGNAGMGICFNVQNTKSNTIKVTSLSTIHGSVLASSTTLKIWINPSPVSGAPGAISAANGWSMVATTTVASSTTTLTTFFPTLAIYIPAGATYGFFVETTHMIGLQTLTGGAGVNTFSNGGVNLTTGDNISYAGTVTSPTFNPYGFVGNITFIDSVVCSGKPTAGTISGINGFCPTQVKSYSLLNNSSQIGTSIIWQSATSLAGPYTTIAGATSSSITRTNTVSTYYRSITTCANGSQKDTSPVFADTLKSFYYCYCASAATSTADTKIESVSFLSTNTVSPSNSTCETYTDYRNISPANAKAGSTFNFSMTNGSCSGNHFPAFGVLYIDLNRDGTFQAGEKIGTTWGASSGLFQTFNTPVTIPFANPKGITGLRVLWYENAPTSACFTYTWGETEDYLINIFVDTIDMAVKSLDTMKSECALSATYPIIFKAANEGSNSIVNPSFSYSINGGTPVTETFSSVLATNVSTYYTFATTANFSTYGAYTIKIWSNNNSDTAKSNDTLSKIVINYPVPPDPIAKHDTVCVGSPSSTVSMTADPNFTTRWYNKSNTQISTASSWTVLNPAATDTFYVRSAFQLTTNVGKPTITDESQIGTTGIGINFNVLASKVLINSVKMKFGSVGIAGIEIRNAANTVVASIGYLVNSIGEQTVPIGVELSAGTGYKMLLATSPGLASISTNFTGFPITLPNVISLTSSNTANQYQYFYDWNITFDKCQSNLVPVYLVYLNSVNSPIKPFAKKKDTFCEYPGKTLDAGNFGCTYKWNDNTINRFLTPIVSGTYIVTITNTSRCNIKDTIKVTINSSPIFSLGNDTTICSGQSTILKSGFTNKGFNHTWSNGKLDPSIVIETPGKYILNVFNTQSNCGYSDTANVYLVPIPSVFLGNDTFICNNGNLKLFAPSDPNYTYKWYDGTTSNQKLVTATVDKLWLEVTDNSSAWGCTNSDTISIKVSTLSKPSLGVDIKTCDPSRIIGLSSTVGLKYNWNTGAISNNISVADNGNYTVTVTEDGTTCSNSDTIKMEFVKTQPLELGPDIITCNKVHTLTAPTGFTSYSWSNGFTNNYTNITSSQTVGLTVSDFCGSKSDQIKLTFETPVSVTLPNDTIICKDYTVSIPSQPTSNQITWSDASHGTSMIIKNTGAYWVRVQNTCGTYSDAIYVIRDSLPVVDFQAKINNKYVNFINNSKSGVKYSWFFGDDSTSSQKNPSHLYLNSGIFTAKLIVENTCGEKEEKSITFTLNGSAISQIDRSNITIYPNPVSEYLNMNADYIENGDFDIKLFSLDGKVVHSESIKINDNILSYRIRVADIANGSYILKLYKQDKIEMNTNINILK